MNHILYVHSSVASTFGYCDCCCCDYGVLPLGFCSDGHGEPGSRFCSDCAKVPRFVLFGILSEIQKEQPPESPWVIQPSVCLHARGFLPGGVIRQKLLWMKLEVRKVKDVKKGSGWHIIVKLL